MDNTEKNNEVLEEIELQEPKEINDLQEEKSVIEEHKKKPNPWLIIISILLLLLIALNTFTVITTYKQNQIENERAEEHQQRVEDYDDAVEEVKRSMNLQKSAISSIMDDFEEAVYNNPNVDNIYQQQFRAAEFNIVVLQLIAMQNSQIIELLSALP